MPNATLCLRLSPPRDEERWRMPQGCRMQGDWRVEERRNARRRIALINVSRGWCRERARERGRATRHSCVSFLEKAAVAYILYIRIYVFHKTSFFNFSTLHCDAIEKLNARVWLPGYLWLIANWNRVSARERRLKAIFFALWINPIHRCLRFSKTIVTDLYKYGTFTKERETKAEETKFSRTD